MGVCRVRVENFNPKHLLFGKVYDGIMFHNKDLTKTLVIPYRFRKSIEE